MRQIKLTPQNQQEVIKESLSALKAGGLVVFPSDTVYGLMADATNSKAVEKLIKFKDRVPGRAISVFMADEKMTEDYVEINQNTKNIINNLLPGPFTVVCQSKQSFKDSKIQTCLPARQGFKDFEAVDKRLLAENGTLGFRIPNYSPTIELVKQFGKPLTATSANLSSKPPHYSVNSFLKSLGPLKTRLALIDLIVDAGKLVKNKPSTVIDATSGQLKTLRIGDLLPSTPNSLISKSEEETKKLARYLAAKFIKKFVSKPLVFLLEGNLGAGKTIFAKGLGKALGVKEEIVSPTYFISNEYSFSNFFISPNSPDFPVNLIRFNNESSCQNTNKDYQNISYKFIHYDLYRIESEDEFKEINFIESIVKNNIYAIEWPERLSQTLISALKSRAEIVYIRINHLTEKEREISWGC